MATWRGGDGGRVWCLAIGGRPARRLCPLLQRTPQLPRPSGVILDRVHTYKRLDEEEEREWNDLYNVVVQGG